MGKFYLVAAAGVGLLFALAASADAGGRRTGQLPGQPFTPPGFSHNTTGQTNGNWNATLGGVPPGLAKCPPGLTSC